MNAHDGVAVFMVEMEPGHHYEPELPSTEINL
jgi:hypothetical protein